MPTESIVLRRLEDREERIHWDSSSPLHLDIETRMGQIKVRTGVFHGGLSEGVEIVRLANETVSVDVLPTRGMSVWRMEAGGLRFGWQSPVVGPVHPVHVPVTEPSGLGWLSGFDEFVVRCGLESNGAPEHDANGKLIFPLHGQIGNTPADSLLIEFDEASGRVDLIGETIESRLFFKRLRMKSRVRLHADRSDVELLDDVTNDLASSATMQLLYHINVGPPVLGKGATVDVALDELAPKDDHAAEEIGRWNAFDDPTLGYQERVYFAQPRSDESGYAHAMLTAADRKSALAVSFKTSSLPSFTLWKNTAETADGYVTGLEPATGFPNTRSFEEKAGRTVSLEAGETRSFRVKLQPLLENDTIEATAAKIKALSEIEPTQVTEQPRGDWSDLE